MSGPLWSARLTLPPEVPPSFALLSPVPACLNTKVSPSESPPCPRPHHRTAAGVLSGPHFPHFRSQQNPTDRRRPYLFIYVLTASPNNLQGPRNMGPSLPCLPLYPQNLIPICFY